MSSTTLLLGQEEQLLHQACCDGNTHLLASLLLMCRRHSPVQSLSAIFSRKNHLGNTPLHSAALSGSLSCVKLLTTMGVDVRQVNNGGYTAAQLASASGHKDIAHFLQGEELKSTRLPLFGLPERNGDILKKADWKLEVPGNGGFCINGFHSTLPGFSDYCSLPTPPVDEHCMQWADTQNDVCRGVKRSRGDDCSNMKRARYEGSFSVGTCLSSLPLASAEPWLATDLTTANGSSPTSTDYHLMRNWEQTYNCILVENMISEVHGS